MIKIDIEKYNKYLDGMIPPDITKELYQEIYFLKDLSVEEDFACIYFHDWKGKYLVHFTKGFNLVHLFFSKEGILCDKLSYVEWDNIPILEYIKKDKLKSEIDDWLK